MTPSAPARWVGSLVLFDIDGTIIRAGDPAHREAFERAMATVCAVDATLDGIPLGGRLDRQIARDALARCGVDDPTIDDVLDEVMATMATVYADLVPAGGRRDWVLPGVDATAGALTAGGAGLGVLTGGARGVARHKLAAAALDERFPVGAYGCEADERSALVDLAVAEARSAGLPVDRDRVVLVGDTPLDVAAAHGAGAAAVAVATGRWSFDELAATGAEVVLPDLGGGATAALAAVLDP